MNNFDFDLGLGSNRPRSLNDQKNKTSTAPSRPAWQPNKTSWTHQPAPPPAQTPLNGPPSMVGDIFGKTWASTGPSVSPTPIGVVNKNPNLFGDLVSSAMGGKVSSTNVPLKNANKSSFSMGNMAGSLPKTTAGTSSGQTGINWGASGSSGGYSSGFNNSTKINTGVNANASKNVGLGGPSLRNMGNAAGVGVGVGGIGSKQDPFVNLVNLASKPSGGISTASTANKGSSNKSGVFDDGFGDFQNAPKPSTTAAFPASGSSSGGNSFMGPDSFSGFADFGTQAKQSNVQSNSDPLDMLFPTSSASAAGSAAASNGAGVEQASGIEDWGREFGGGVHDVGGSTTELEGLPPPPAGVSAPAAKSKGMENYKQGQYPDAIKWLSWAVVLLEKAADRSALSDVLSSRASCYKEVGEYKKAVADCTKVLEQDGANVSVLVQRALLYESMEKYRLGAEDLRSVLKIDPGNRVARGTIHRLTQLAD